MSLEAPLCVSERTTPEIDRCIARGLLDKTFSAAACVASSQGGLFQRGAYGSTHKPPPVRKVEHTTLFDLGNLTMPLGAGLAALHLVSKHRLELSTPVASVLKDFCKPPYTRVTVDMLLDHTSGLPADAELYKALHQADKSVHPNERVTGTRKAIGPLQKAFYDLHFEAPPGTRTQVSNLGFLLLGWMIEAVVGKPLDLFLRQEIFSPMALADDLMFMPLGARLGIGPKKQFAATLQCPWRNKLLCGEVYDPNAWAQGGVAGHAGLFGTASGIWRLAQRLLECYGGKHDFFHTGTVARFWTRSRRVESTRTLGWDTPTVLASSAGKRLSRTSVGHVSQMGTSLWIDYSNDIIGVYLSNAAHPTLEAKADAIFKADARVFELVAAQGALGPPPPDADEALQQLMAHGKRPK